MTQEDKELLLKDLCARLPYGVHCYVLNLNKTIKEDDDILYGFIGDNVITLKFDEDECLMYYQIKPYLRHLSSMTEEEFIDFMGIRDKNLRFCDIQEMMSEYLSYPNIITVVNRLDKYSHNIDWLNKKMFDYRGLIEKGLAIAVTNENNPYK